MIWLFLIPFFVLSISDGAFAASTGTTNLLLQSGSGYATQGGDYVSSSGGLRTYYQYYIEVPPGLSRLRVRLYDGDIGRGGTGDANDFQVGTGWNTSCTYTLYNPSGASVATLTGNATTLRNARWDTLYDTTTTPIPNGHWRLVVNSSSSSGDDYNGYGFSADDGSDTAAGTELNIYALSFLPIGVKGPSPTTKTSTFYPYVTSGCTVDWNDFDGDDSGGSYCRISYASRLGTITTTTYNGAANDVWQNRAITGFNTDLVNRDSGVWTATGRYTTLSGSTGNFGVFWAGNWQAADGTPSAQPQADSFRVYLPRDGGGAPAKPYVTQKLSFVSGPNPPASGSTTRVRVEIAVFNPAAQAITFSSSNTVTATIPGSGVVYAGNPIVSQGAVVSAPSSGGSGDITWNPGTVAAGGTATFYYCVDVTPTSAGQRLPVTGSSGTDGTTATFVDTTGNTTQTQATYTYGPLCGLAVTEEGDPIPTWVAISCFEPCAGESQPTVEWHTATEVGAVGFYLWRQDRETREFQLVNPNFLPALPNSPQGGVYRLADPVAPCGEPVVYRIDEVDSQGRTLSYGPFTVTFGSASMLQETEAELGQKGGEEPSEIYGFQRFPRQRSLYEQGRLKKRQLELVKAAALAASKRKERTRITVKGRGLFYVNATKIANSMGISAPYAMQLIAQYKLNLTSLGNHIAWLAAADGSGIFFYNQGKETAYADRNVYWLTLGNGLPMETVSAGNGGPAAAEQSYKESLHFEKNQYALSALFDNPAADIWLWDYVIAGSGSKSFAIDVPGVAASGSATLSVSLQGETNTAADNDHHAIVSLNGSEIGSAYWDGAKAHSFDITFAASLLREGANTISVSGALDMGASYSIFYVESFDLAYQRHYQAVGNALLCRGDGNSVITVSHLSELQVVVLDVSNPLRPRQLIGAAPDLGGRVTFVPQGPDKNYLLSGLNAALRPLAVVGDQPARLEQRDNTAEYLVIAPEEFADTAQGLVDFRKKKGLNAKLVTLEDIYEAFNDGMSSPLAIRKFLTYAYNQWSGNKVKYAVLAGKGTYDYKDYLGYGDNLVPVILAETPEGLFAADKEFGDVTGTNGIPEIAIGRLPAISNAELQTMIDKIKAYENGQGAWTNKAIMIADNTDEGGNFAGSSDELAGLASGFQAKKIYLKGSATEARSKIITAWNAGAALVNYCGHGGLKQLAQENLFNISDAQALSNGGQLPLAVMLTCVAGRFELPGFTSLSEALLLSENGGIAAGLMPSGAGMHAQSMRLGEGFYKAAFSGPGTTAGQALLAAMKSYLNSGGMKYLLCIYNWLGDPALACK